jgi:hypothetical protein
MFEGTGGRFSWRKGLTAIAASVFAVVCIAYLFGCPELPQSYQAIIAGVFAFYFMKDRLRSEGR